MVTGQKEDVESLKQQLQAGQIPDLSSQLMPHAVAGVIKLFFREHPEPLMTFDAYEAFVDAQRKGMCECVCVFVCVCLC
jgi:CRISPR/Cas system type I-B associated protein Csh2 (Cas7 group RAMP superfamily)